MCLACVGNSSADPPRSAGAGSDAGLPAYSRMEGRAAGNGPGSTGRSKTKSAGVLQAAADKFA